MASKDDKRRDKIQSPAPNKAFLDNYDAVFGKVCDECGKRDCYEAVFGKVCNECGKRGCEDCATENKDGTV